MITHAALLDRIDRHLARTGELPSQFGKRIAQDSNLVRDLKGGRSPRLELALRIWEATADISQPPTDAVTRQLDAMHAGWLAEEKRASAALDKLHGVAG